MKTFTLITGASAGIGYEMARLLAEKKHPLILVARSKHKLNHLEKSLTATYGIPVMAIVMDLSEPNAAQKLYFEVKERGLEVSHLVNNAGFGDYGLFAEMDLEHMSKMVQLNITTLMSLTRLFLPDMISREYGKVMNVASLLSFIPFPFYTVYSATKTFVLAFSETLAAELEGTGVDVTALCPGTVETGFHTPGMRKTNAMKSNPPMSAKKVAEEGVKLLLEGKGKKVVGFNNWLISNLPRVTPDFLMMKIKKQLASSKN